MKNIKIIYLIIVTICLSCNHPKPKNDQMKILGLSVKNANQKEITVTLKNTTDSFSVVLPTDSVFEILSLKDSCQEWVESLNNKYSYFSYKVKDSVSIILIDKSKNKVITDLDLVPKMTGKYSRTEFNNKEIKETIYGELPLK